MKKLCKTCKQEKPFDPEAKRQSKAGGFMGNVCWTCYVAYMHEYQKKPVELAGKTMTYSQAAEVRRVQARHTEFLAQEEANQVYKEAAGFYQVCLTHPNQDPDGYGTAGALLERGWSKSEVLGTYQLKLLTLPQRKQLIEQILATLQDSSPTIQEGHFSAPLRPWPLVIQYWQDQLALCNSL